MRRVIFNKKGGVGKSTITCNLAAVSAKRGKRTLVIDLDPQCNSTQYLLGSAREQPKTTMADYFKEFLRFSLLKDRLESFIQETPFPNLFILPSHPELTDLEVKLEARYKMLKLRESLQFLHGYDEVFIDTPPALNFYTRSALIACRSCLIPFDCDDFSRRALYDLIENVNEIRQDHNPELEIEGIVVNQFQARAKLPIRMVEGLREEGLPVLTPYLSSSIQIRESHQRSLPMIHLSPHHKLSQQFDALYAGLLERSYTKSTAELFEDGERAKKSDRKGEKRISKDEALS